MARVASDAVAAVPARRSRLDDEDELIEAKLNDR